MTGKGPTAAAFFDAVRKGNDSAVDAALAAEPQLLDARDETGFSPVLVAANSARFKMAMRIAALEAKTTDGLDVFDAAATGNVAVARSLLTTDRASVDDRGPGGYTALHFAASFGQLEIARLLLGLGADPNAVSLNEARLTPLHSAVAARHRDTASLLLALGGSPNAVRHGGWTPLHTAACDGDESIADILLLRGADPTRATDEGKTAIDLAEEYGHGALAGVLRKAASRR
jgi:ankyrin repeat protein